MNELTVAPKLELASYPAAIAQNAVRLAQVDLEICKLKRAIANYDAQFEHAAAFDGNLKNELQRRAVVNLERAEHLDYQAKVNQLDELQVEKAVTTAMLEQLRSDFSVAKLQVRMAIASQLVGAESADLLGV